MLGGYHVDTSLVLQVTLSFTAPGPHPLNPFVRVFSATPHLLCDLLKHADIAQVVDLALDPGLLAHHHPADFLESQ